MSDKRKMNKQLFVSSFLLSCTILIACHNMQRNARSLIGCWHWVKKIESDSALSELALLSNFEPNGDLTYTGSGVIRVGKNSANFRIQGKSKWKIINGFYFEKDEYNKLINVSGDKIAADIVKEVYSFENVEDKWIKWKILRYNKSTFIIESEDKEEVIELKKVWQ
jgi:hypothetical protein